MTPSPPLQVSLRDVGRAALILTGGTAAVQVIGIVRELYLAAQVGLSADLDALLVALALPTTIAAVLTSGLVTALVPAYVDARETGGRDAARRFSGAILTWVGIGGIVLTGTLLLLADPAISITGPGFAAQAHDRGVDYLRVLAPLAFLGSTSGILRAVSQAEERFMALAVSGFAGTAAGFVIMLVLWPLLGLHAFALGIVVGQAVIALVLVGSLSRAATLPRITLRATDVEMRSFLRHAAPLTASAAILQVNIVVDRAIASLLAPGAVSALRYAEVLVRTPISTISPAWGSAMYPALVRAGRRQPDGGVGATTEISLRYALVAFVPLAALTAAVGSLAVAVAYGRGAFSGEDVSRTAQVVVGFAPLIVILMTSPVLAAAHNARRSGVVLLLGGILNVVLNTILDVTLGSWLGVAGIALSSSLTAAIVATYFARRLATVERSFRLNVVGRTLLLSVLATLLPATVVFLAAQLVPADLAVMLAALTAFGALGLLAYGVLATLLGLTEPRILASAVIGGVRERLGR